MSIDLLSQSPLVDVSFQANTSTIKTAKKTITVPEICNCSVNPITCENPGANSKNSGKKCVVCGEHCGRPTLLDLFSGAGGAAYGYRKAGFCVLGIDIKPQPRYAGCRFHQADAMTYPLDGFDVIHASPPCQDHMRVGQHPVHGTGWMLGAIRERLKNTDAHWVIENVPGAPLNVHYSLCGCMFGIMALRRERWFECSKTPAVLLPTHNHREQAISVVGHGTPSWVRNALGRCPSIKEYRALMGIDWMNRGELSQAIPPAYTEFIGKQLMEQL